MGSLNISVIIPARDCEEVIGACLQGLSRQTFAPAEVILVDDGSADRTADKARTAMPEARIISLERPRGFAAACAAGYAEAKGEWIALLNADTEPDPQWLEKMAEAAAAAPRVGMVASRLLLAGKEPLVDSLGLKLSRTGMVFLRGHKQKETGSPRPAAEEVFGPSAAACMYSQAMLERTGFFDPSFIAYYEDADLAFRGQWLGFKCILANHARVLHRHSYSYGRNPSWKRERLQANRLRTIIRNWPGNWLIKYLGALAAAEGASFFKALAEKSFSAPFSARADFIRHLKGDLAVRSRTMKEREVTEQELSYWLFHESRALLPGNAMKNENAK